MAENTTSQEFSDRLKKLEDIRKQGVNPYPERYERTHKAVDAVKLGEKGLRAMDAVIAENKNDIKLCGRLVAFRSHGKISFGNLQDVSGQIQICIAQNVIGDENYDFFSKKIDIADFIGVSGELFLTRTNQITLMVKEFILLGKTLRPLPEKWHGLQDTETKYRYRYLDTVMDRNVMDRFLMRTKLISLIREYMNDREFIEVETPVLSAKASGAIAKPFVTHHNAFDKDFFLRIAPETYLKRLIVGGFERVYEFARCFRNEGIDPSHHQEFTMLEYYAAYFNYEDNMKFTENLFEHFIKELFGTLKLNIYGTDIDFTPPWPRKTMRELIIEHAGIDIEEFHSAEKLRKAITDKKIKIDGDIKALGYGNMVDALYKKTARQKLIQPIFVTSHPIELSPLARQNDAKPHTTDRFQLVVNTWEVVNAYSELVDPVDQRARLTEQANLKSKGDVEAMEMDEDYLLAMEHGMPPISGWGMGIDRIFALLTSQENLKDVILFPLMRPEENNE
ncbi:MAG: lysyl-tRNA synthetase, lysyl-tRNA synthetase, class II [Candidatus Peregrinibacteria bacterium GW2011_GWC2_39_14]|nr:MAG: Lysyl-tRNA synthetase [Candidatus Peregrinibacteria bacterium GW2011_GWA2_38_36]KKR07226.1 MAG: lysyl-tRNA synthetase, lysyl-tRNA synthetase, class II [Candidatus Peregrinibacteria bacterium GW2011_GWC2_39_14]